MTLRMGYWEKTEGLEDGKTTRGKSTERLLQRKKNERLCWMAILKKGFRELIQLGDKRR